MDIGIRFVVTTNLGELELDKGLSSFFIIS